MRSLAVNDDEPLAFYARSATCGGLRARKDKLGDLRTDRIRSSTWSDWPKNGAGPGTRRPHYGPGQRNCSIISGHAYVSPAGQATLRQLGVSHDGRIEGLSAMTAAVHRKDGRIMMQLAHGGLGADAKFSNMTPMGPSVAEGLLEPPGREMTIEDIRQTVGAFGQAARRPKLPALTGFKFMPPTDIYSASSCHPRSTGVTTITAATFMIVRGFFWKCSIVSARPSANISRFLLKLTLKTLLKKVSPGKTACRWRTCWRKQGLTPLKSAAGHFYPVKTFPFARRSHLSAIKPIFAGQPKN